MQSKLIIILIFMVGCSMMDAPQQISEKTPQNSAKENKTITEVKPKLEDAELPLGEELEESNNVTIVNSDTLLLPESEGRVAPDEIRDFPGPPIDLKRLGHRPEELRANLLIADEDDDLKIERVKVEIRKLFRNAWDLSEKGEYAQATAEVQKVQEIIKWVPYHYNFVDPYGQFAQVFYQHLQKKGSAKDLGSYICEQISLKTQQMNEENFARSYASIKQMEKFAEFLPQLRATCHYSDQVKNALAVVAKNQSSKVEKSLVHISKLRKDRQYDQALSELHKLKKDLVFVSRSENEKLSQKLSTKILECTVEKDREIHIAANDNVRQGKAYLQKELYQKAVLSLERAHKQLLSLNYKHTSKTLEVAKLLASAKDKKISVDIHALVAKGKQLLAQGNEEEGTAAWKQAQKMLTSIPYQQDRKLRDVSRKIKQYFYQRQTPTKKHRNVAQIRVGENQYLTLKELRVIVKVEDFRVRTIVDHVFYNPFPRQLEGSFRYSLPDNASMGYFAFYPDMEKKAVRIGDASAKLPQLPSLTKIADTKIDDFFKEETNVFGDPKVAHVVPKQKALIAYEETTRRRVDPALVEWVSENTFRARVFPLQERGYQRVVIAYDQTLPVKSGRCEYQFQLPDLPQSNISAVLLAKTPGMCNLRRGPKHDRWFSYELHGAAENILYAFQPRQHQFIFSKDGGNRYMYGSVDLQIPRKKIEREESPAIFLLDTSLSQETIEFEHYVQLLENILKHNRISKFNVLLFDVESRWLYDDWQLNTSETRRNFKKNLDGLLLEGATNIENALSTLAEKLTVKGIDVFVLSNGAATWGELSLKRVIAKFKQEVPHIPSFFCYNLQSATTHELANLVEQFGGNIFATSVGDDMEKVATAHCHEPFLVGRIETDGLQDVIFHHDFRSVYPGQQLIVAGKVVSQNPTITIHGSFAGKSQVFPITILDKEDGELAARGFGEMVVKRMENLDDPNLEKTIIAYAKHFSIPGKTCSLLMLDTKEDYKRFQVDLHKNTTLQQVAFAIRYSQVPENVSFFKSDFDYVLQSLPQQALEKSDVVKILALVRDEDFAVHSENLPQNIKTYHDIPAEYLRKRNQNSEDLHNYIVEGKRRYDEGLVADYIRCLSCAVEEQPRKSDVLRMVAYDLLAKEKPEYALGLLVRVCKKRPFEPQSYRDIAKCYASMKNYKVAALYYEITLAGKWHRRFQRINTATAFEYAYMIQQALYEENLHEMERKFWQERLVRLVTNHKVVQKKADVVVIVTWNTDNSDVDLWVTEPNGEECGHSNRKTQIGGRLLDDVLQGYGPELYILPKAPSGKYSIATKYYSANTNRLEEATFVNVTVITRAGDRDQKVHHFCKMLSQTKQTTPIYSFSWPER
ncbi:hypothetical protein [Candidatus Uabimicrobium amorphum]|uniref:VIT domain-containing protein n=1 Tax=Uabimicrobium amorphum TaxID=2596890 RepID=A0A5S9ILU1_UABAM|nr:hypothetical protein [Candidatus Uabimicrobium amorphum]BBM84239.1 hypothetical protein UABAM_02595 [Candidatus Uabimicrobium amorphum]